MYLVAMGKGKQPPVNAVTFLVAKLFGEDETVRLALEMLKHILGEKREQAIKPFNFSITDIDIVIAIVLNKYVIFSLDNFGF